MFLCIFDIELRKALVRCVEAVREYKTGQKLGADKVL